ncbi:MAG: hypothetical protein IAI50_03110, partial [Candidatus Eremiobacteraeota bacterium]|nr:hypothetical protein [Candidatus Eremiobacteraeota bacterium]
MYEPDFAWPAGFRPYESRLYVRNRLDMDASVEAVWASLVAAPLWPTWFPNATAVALPAGRDILEASMKFSWSQSGVRLASDVREHAR